MTKLIKWRPVGSEKRKQREKPRVGAKPFLKNRFFIKKWGIIAGKTREYECEMMFLFWKERRLQNGQLPSEPRCSCGVRAFSAKLFQKIKMAKNWFQINYNSVTADSCNLHRKVFLHCAKKENNRVFEGKKGRKRKVLLRRLCRLYKKSCSDLFDNTDRRFYNGIINETGRSFGSSGIANEGDYKK